MNIKKESSKNLKQQLVVRTGKFTGRSPKDRYIVRTNKNKNIIDWGIRNKFISEKSYDEIYIKIENYLFKKLNYQILTNVIPDNNISYEVKLITEEEWYIKFAKNIFRNDNYHNLVNKISIFHAPYLELDKMAH